MKFNLRLKGKILLSYLVPMSALLAAIIWAAWMTENVVKNFTRASLVQQMSDRTHHLEIAHLQMSNAIRGYLIERRKNFKRDDIKGEKFLAETVDILGEYKLSKENLKVVFEGVELTSLLELRKDLDIVIEQIKSYDKIGDRMVDLVDKNRSSEALNLFRQQPGEEIAKQFTELDSHLHAIYQKLVIEEEKLIKESLENLLKGLIFLAISLGCLAGISIWLTTSQVETTIAMASDAIATSSNEIATMIKEQEKTANSQASSVNQTTTTVEILGKSSQESAQQAQTATKSAQKVMNMTEEGNHAVKETLERMNILKTKVAAIANQILILNQQNNQIGNISQLVSNIANQTNMLALNASVEAVRAGEGGKGFSVVASEIRKLADESKKSAAKINTLVMEIQTAINSTVSATKEGTENVDLSMITTEKMAIVFTEVTDAVNNFVISNEQISLNIQQQANAMEQIIIAMNSLNQGAKETAIGMSLTKKGTERLNEVSQQLKNIV